MNDLALGDLALPPAERKFSLTVDAKRILDLLLADNFSLILHGHQHTPFCGVERRLSITKSDMSTPPDCQVAVAAAGSLFVGAPHATHNQFQVIDLEEKTVKIGTVEIHLSDPKYREFKVVIEKGPLMQPDAVLYLRDEDSKLLDDRKHSIEDSLICAENVYGEQRSGSARAMATSLVFQAVSMQKKRVSQLSDLNENELENLFRTAVEAWMGADDPLRSYRQDGASALPVRTKNSIRTDLAVSKCLQRPERAGFAANLFGDYVRRHKKQPNGMSPSTVCEEWRLFRRQLVRNDDAVRQFEEFARPDPSLEVESLD